MSVESGDDAGRWQTVGVRLDVCHQEPREELGPLLYDWGVKEIKEGEALWPGWNICHRKVSHKARREPFHLKKPGCNKATENASFFPISPIYRSLTKLNQKVLSYELLTKLPVCFPFGHQR